MRSQLVMLGMVVAVSACAAPPSQMSATPASSRNDCLVWVSASGVPVCRHAALVIQAADAAEVPALIPESPQEVVGEERPNLVLDGAS
jgi:hypothetical protein